eukprot:3543462-Pyramimonas_sp.AAC.1
MNTNTTITIVISMVRDPLPAPGWTANVPRARASPLSPLVRGQDSWALLGRGPNDESCSGEQMEIS